MSKSILTMFYLLICLTCYWQVSEFEFITVNEAEMPPYETPFHAKKENDFIFVSGQQIPQELPPEATTEGTPEYEYEPEEFEVDTNSTKTSFTPTYTTTPILRKRKKRSCIKKREFIQEAENVLSLIIQIVNKGGGTKDNILMTNNYLRNISYTPYLKKAYMNVFDINLPVLTIIEVLGLINNANLQIDAIAIVGNPYEEQSPAFD